MQNTKRILLLCNSVLHIQVCTPSRLSCLQAESCLFATNGSSFSPEQLHPPSSDPFMTRSAAVIALLFLARSERSLLSEQCKNNSSVCRWPRLLNADDCSVKFANQSKNICSRFDSFSLNLLNLKHVHVNIKYKNNSSSSYLAFSFHFTI